MILHMADVVFREEIEAAERYEKKKAQEEKMANYFGQPKSKTEDDADEVIVVENPDEL